MKVAMMVLCLAPGVWLFISTNRRLVGEAFDRSWRILFVVVCCLGCLLGFGLMGIRYSVSPNVRVYGMPFVVAGGELVNGRWVDGGVGRAMPLPFLGDLAFGVGICLLPLAWCAWARERKVNGMRA